MTSTWEIRVGDALTRLREMPDRSVQTVITSPPYFGLRDYGTGEWEAGEVGCDHVAPPPGGHAASGLGNYDNGLSAKTIADKITQRQQQYRDVCGKCGARRTDQQLGLEATPDAFIAALVEVFREVRRVLRDDGTLWCNMGDSYAGTWGNQGRKAERGTQRPVNGEMLTPVHDGRYPSQASGTGTIPEGVDYKAKDLLMIPAQLALALRADGWYLRSDIILAKVNPMPESVRDRPTSAHEHMFLLAKRASYFYDADAIREDAAPATLADRRMGTERVADFASAAEDFGNGTSASRRMARNAVGDPSAGRNKRNVWTVATEPFPGAHFATFGCKWIEPCVLAGSSPKACGECGAPWKRVVEMERTDRAYERGSLASDHRALGRPQRSGSGSGALSVTTTTTGWESSCAHDDDDTGRSVILDPFAGSGTTGVVALRHDRSFIGIELNPAYAEMARNRIRDDAPLLNTLAEVAA